MRGFLDVDQAGIPRQTRYAIEKLFEGRLPEFYETLAFHFKQSQSIPKAVHYLMKAGEKSQGRYALEEAHQYFKEAFDLFTDNADKTEEEQKLLIDLVLNWSEVFHFRGAYSGLIQLLNAHENLVQTLNNKSRLGMFYAWLGTGLRYREELRDSYQCLLKALKLGEETKNHRVIGHACCCLTGTCTELGLLEEAIRFGRRANEISTHIKPDHEIFRSSLFEMGLAYAFKWDRKKVAEVGKSLIDYGKKISDPRSMANGYLING